MFKKEPSLKNITSKDFGRPSKFQLQVLLYDRCLPTYFIVYLVKPYIIAQNVECRNIYVLFLIFLISCTRKITQSYNNSIS